MTNLIEERNERTKNRKKRKKKMDSIIGLSKNEERQTMKLSSKMKLADTSIRLLDEGFCDNGFVIKKGTLSKYLNGQNEYIRGWEQTEDGWVQTDVLNLTDDFVGNVNIGHMEFATFPFIVGEWKKSDLTLVDIENDRKALDVNLRLDEESVFLKELARQPYDIGVSAEFYYHINEEDTESLSEMLNEYIPVIDEIFIFAYGLVGECGNVNSSGLELKGETMPKNIETVGIELKLENAEEVKSTIEEIKENLEELNAIKGEIEVETPDEAENEAELGVEEIDITINEEEAEETASEDALDESVDTEDEEPEEDESDEEGEIEEVSEDADDEDEAEEVDFSFEGIIEEICNLRKENLELKEHIKALKQKNKRLDKKLKSEYTAKEEFLAKTANLTAELFPNEGEAEKQEEEEAKKLAEKRKYYKGDGIAD